jgi:hypothetical protein
MIKTTEVFAGLYWAKRIEPQRHYDMDGWHIICIFGDAPFLGGYIVAYQEGIEVWRSTSYKLDISFDAHDWEFVQRIEIPEVQA